MSLSTISSGNGLPGSGNAKGSGAVGAAGAVGIGTVSASAGKASVALLMIREFFRTTYRATEGFGKSLAALIQADIAIPDFTSLAKRAAKLGIDIDVTQYTADG